MMENFEVPWKEIAVYLGGILTGLFLVGAV